MVQDIAEYFKKIASEGLSLLIFHENSIFFHVYLKKNVTCVKFRTLI